MTNSAFKPFLLALESFYTGDRAGNVEWTFVELTSADLNVLTSLRHDLHSYSRVREFVGAINDLGLKPGYFPAQYAGVDLEGESRDVTVRRDTLHFSGFAQGEELPFEARAVNFDALAAMLDKRKAGLVLGDMLWLSEDVLVCTSMSPSCAPALITQDLWNAVGEEIEYLDGGAQEPATDVERLVRNYLPSIADLAQ